MCTLLFINLLGRVLSPKGMSRNYEGFVNTAVIFFDDTIRTTTDLVGCEALDRVINGGRMEIAVAERFRLNLSGSEKHLRADRYAGDATFF